MQLTIRFDDQNRTLYADLSPSEEPEAISFLSIKEKVEEAGYKNVNLPPKTISEVLANVQQGKEGTFALKTLVDATAAITIDSDKRQAFLTLTAADGGQPLTFDLITQAITNGSCEG